MTINPDKWTHKTTEAFSEATAKATAASHPEVTVQHLIVALLGQREGLVLPILQASNVDHHAIANSANQKLAQLPKVYGASLQISRELHRVLTKADQTRVNLSDEYLSTEHLLLSLADDLELDREALLVTLRDMRGTSRVTSKTPENTNQALERFGHDLTQTAKAGKLDPVIGRDEEIRRVIRTLARRRKNNPVLIGEPGVGKTAIVEGLAQRIVEGDVPENLAGKQLIAIDMAAIVAGAKYRGEFEERLQSVLNEITESDGQIITFIDELHTVVGAGKTEGSIDAGNMLKPMLARGALRMIGATTLNEYRLLIEPDAALERRFQPVLVEQPTVNDTIAILRGLRERYEIHHGVRIKDSALIAAATLSDRYITGRFLPDKAIDLIDEAASSLRMEIDSVPTEIDVVQRRLRQLEMERVAAADNNSNTKTPNMQQHDLAQQRLQEQRIQDIDKEIGDLTEKQTTLTARWQAEKDAINSIQELNEEIENQRSELERENDLGKAAEIRYGILPELQLEMEQATAHLAELQTNSSMLTEEVDEEHIASVVSRSTGVPVSRLMEGEASKLLRLEEHLHDRVVGQDEAVNVIANSIRRNRVGLNDRQKPIGSFLFLGPTGVGKTELARALADFLFDRNTALIRIDMSEYMEKHSVARMIGAPPGYVGHDAGGQLTESVRRKPYAVILLDEVEKAHRDVFNVLLQLLDDGRLTDGQGRTVDFTNTVIIMTSNLQGEPGEFFRPEFVNRIDDIVRFKPLNRNELHRIVELQLNELRTRLHDKRIVLNISEDVLRYLATTGYSSEYGARPLKRVIQRTIGDQLAVAMLENRVQDGYTIEIGMAPTMQTMPAAQPSMPPTMQTSRQIVSKPTIIKITPPSSQATLPHQTPHPATPPPQ